MKTYACFDRNMMRLGTLFQVGEVARAGADGFGNFGAFKSCRWPLDCFADMYPAEAIYCEVDVDDNDEESFQDFSGKPYDSSVMSGSMTVVRKLTPDNISDAVLSTSNTAHASNAEHHVEHSSQEASVVFEKGDGSVAATTGEAAASVTSGSSGIAASTSRFGFAHARDCEGGIAALTGESGMSAASGELCIAAMTGAVGRVDASGLGAISCASGDESVADAYGGGAIAASSGYMGEAHVMGYVKTGGCVAAATGVAGRAEAFGEGSVAVATGIDSSAKGHKGSWLVLADYRETQQGTKPFGYQLFKVDGDKVKEDVWYRLANGSLVELGRGE